jgi:type II secretory pathway pseudopilin PulG
MQFFRDKSKGFTLAEMVVYAALLSIISIVVINIFITITGLFREAKEVRAVRLSAETALERINREVRFSSTISGGGNGSNSITLQSINPSTEATETVVLELNENRIKITKAGNESFLTSAAIPVDSLIFYNIDTGVSEGVTTRLTIDNRNFYSAAVLRRGY